MNEGCSGLQSAEYEEQEHEEEEKVYGRRGIGGSGISW